MVELKFEPRFYLTRFVHLSSLKELLFYKVGVQKGVQFFIELLNAETIEKQQKCYIVK